MKIAFSNSQNNRNLFLITQALQRETNGILYSVILDFLENIIQEINPEYFVLTHEQLEDDVVKKFFKKKKSSCHTKFLLLTWYSDTRIQEMKDRSGLDVININPDSFEHINEYYMSDTHQSDYWLCELNCSNYSFNQNLGSILYPQNKTHKVRLVNCDQVSHPQNIGIANEKDMIDLISGCDGYINLTSNYLSDAVYRNKPVLSFVDNKFTDTSANITMSNILESFRICEHNFLPLPSAMVKQCLNR